MDPSDVPADIKLRRKSRVLQLSYANGMIAELPFELLRVYSPSAEVQGHGQGNEVLQTGKRHVDITAMEAVGNYAVKLTFSDGHDSGIYSWAYLKQLADRREQYWQDYLKRLEAAGGSREPGTVQRTSQE